MYPINLIFYKSPSNKLYLQSLQPNKSILIHIAPVYVLGNILTYCAANGGANQWTTMVLLSLFPVKCWVLGQEQSKWRYTNNFIYRRLQSVWYIPKPTEGVMGRRNFSAFPPHHPSRSLRTRFWWLGTSHPNWGCKCPFRGPFLDWSSHN